VELLFICTQSFSRPRTTGEGTQTDAIAYLVYISIAYERKLNSMNPRVPQWYDIYTKLKNHPSISSKIMRWEADHRREQKHKLKKGKMKYGEEGKIEKESRRTGRKT
jgi:hypothetical protein